MNKRMILNILGSIVISEGIFIIIPLIVSLIYKEKTSAIAFLITIGIALGIGLLLKFIFKTKNRTIYAKEGFVVVSLAWLIMSLIGALPFVISGEIPSYINAFFETVSGFTTTGASILTDVESMSHGMLFWRSFTHWVGGMGVLVFVMAVLPSITEGSIHLIRAEMPGPIVGKLVPKAKETARILYLIYIVLTTVEVILLLCGGMNLFDSLLHSFGTAGTGGFGIKALSVAEYSPYIQWVITIFMLIFGINFNLFYLILIGRIKNVLKSSELWVYVGIVTVSVASIIFNVGSMYSSLWETVRHSAFQVSSIITTTGFSTTDFNLWPDFSKTILLILMFIGGCAGSTAGGLKISRVILLFKMVRSEIKHLLHPRSVNSVKFEGKVIDNTTKNSVVIYFATYVICFVAILLVISIEPFDFESNFSTAVSCFNNVGPAFSAFGPLSNYSGYSDLSTVILSFAMLLGRLEIFPLLITLSPSTWSKK